MFTRTKVNTKDVLFESLNNYHPNIKLTIELHPKKLLDTKLILVNDIYSTMVNRKSTKLPIPWSSKVPKRYKRNAIIGDLHQSKRISMNFADEVKHIKSKFLRADYPLRFVDSIIRNFLSENDVEESFIIPPNLFDEDKPFLLIDIPFCEKNESKSKDFIKKFHHFTNGKYRISIKWITKKVKSLFPLKDKNIYPACKIYHGLCS